MNLTGTDRFVLARWLPWALPLTLTALSLVYELIEHQLEWVVGHANFGFEVLVFGVVGPAAVFVALVYMQRTLRARVDAEQKTALLNRGLEEEVAERTRHLEEAQGALREQAERLAAMNLELRRLDELKSDFVALVSHELRSPLTNLSGGIELIAAEAATLPASSQRTLGIIGAESMRLRTLVESILDVSRLEAGHLQLTPGAVSVEAMVRACALSVAGHEPSRIQTPTHGPIPPVWADELYLEEVLRNVLTNGLKYSVPGEPVVVTISAEDHEVTVEVMNRGPSIPEEDQRRLFEPFYRGAGGEQRPAGHGLGLYFARRLLEAQGGRIAVESPAFPGTDAPGAAFRITLPVAHDEVA
jgi:signal transduction histidine kinase